MLKTEVEFKLPRGYVDLHGNLHNSGTMRLATALDEVEPLLDTRARANSAYLSILLISRVVTRLGNISPISEKVVEGLFASDFTYLESLYLQLNEDHSSIAETECPVCRTRFAVDFLGVYEHGS